MLGLSVLRQDGSPPLRGSREESCARCAFPAEIDFDHPRVVLHVVDRALGQHRPFVQHGHPGAEAADERPCRARRRRRAVAAPDRGSARRSPRFRGRSCRRPARRAAAARGPGSAACRSRATASGRGSDVPASCRPGRPSPICARVASMRSRCSRSTAARAGSPRSAVAGERQLEVLEDGQVLEHGRPLELAADAEIGDLGLVEPGQIGRCREEHLA